MTRFGFEWIGAHDAGDPLEQRTWARLELSAREVILTRVRDRRGKSERDSIFVPLFPLARWIVTNWWSLLYEPWPFDTELPAPGTATTSTEREWIHRHCIRAATSGYASPFVCLFGQGTKVAISSRPDPYDCYLHTPVDFVATADSTLDRIEIHRSLAEFVDSVLARLDGLEDERIAALVSDWKAVSGAREQEAEFCRAAGRLGLDPYRIDTWSEGLAEWLERVPPGELDTDFVVDLLEAPDSPSLKPKHHDSLSRIRVNLQLTESEMRFGPEPEPEPQPQWQAPERTAYEEGYSLATWVRSQLGLPADRPLDDLRDAAVAACNQPLDIHEDQPLPVGRILAVVGWQDRRVPSVAPQPQAQDVPAHHRFLCARGLHMALQGSSESPRLVTDAKTWGQRASRAFGAELLAPRAGVEELVSTMEKQCGSDEATTRVADHFNVSPMIIQHQLENLRRRFIDR